MDTLALAPLSDFLLSFCRNYLAMAVLFPPEPAADIFLAVLPHEFTLPVLLVHLEFTRIGTAIRIYQLPMTRHLIVRPLPNIGPVIWPIVPSLSMNLVVEKITLIVTAILKL